MLNPFWSFELALDWYRTAMDAATTVGARTPILWQAAMTGSPHAMREPQRMVREKAQAALAGTAAAGTQVFRIWARNLSASTLPSSADWADVANAAWRPARRACRANARRFTGTGRRKRSLLPGMQQRPSRSAQHVSSTRSIRT